MDVVGRRTPGWAGRCMDGVNEDERLAAAPCISSSGFLNGS